LVIQAAAQLEIGQVNTFVGRDWTKSVDDNWPRFLETWQPLVKFAEEHNVRIGIENGPAARIWPLRRASGGGCSKQFPAPISG
jgi:sugar phosphate isomerase/epimerase